MFWILRLSLLCVLDIEGERVVCLFAETACRVTIPM